ncbi:dynamin family protein [Stutzerimonas xanthomarina]|uniref:dynamin family protein n=1 Tax=Stutzerimonas xanthomarina TaxID=271420 RepID=UPI003AA8699A
MADVWLRKFRQRNDWAKQAYDRFVAEVDPELVGDFTRPEHITVVVYGTTQVGKTTLILNLLGIHKEALPAVGEVLRGGQRLGKSSTASPIRYGRSPDHLWYMGEDATGLSDDEAAERFGEIREQVMNGIICSSALLNVRIPYHFFKHEEDGALSLDLRLIDIPGINAINAHEQIHVRRIAERYVASADLILLVGRADNLGFLHPSALDFEALNDWMLQPSRFRVVLTYTFSPASFQTWFGKAQDASPLTARDVQQHLYDEMCTHDERPPAEMLKHIYPLEFGDSLESMRSHSQAYFERASHVIEALRRELLASITDAASPYARLWSAFRVGDFIEAKVKRQNDEFNNRRPHLECAISKAQHGVIDARTQLSDAADEHLRVEWLHRRNEQRLKYFNRGAYLPRLKRYFTLDIKLDGGETVTVLRQALSAFQLRIRRHWSNLWEGLKYSSAKLDVGEMSPPSTLALRALEASLDRYWIDSYLLSSSFQTDVSILRNQAAMVGYTYAEAANQALGTQLKTMRDHAVEQRRNSETILKAIKLEVIHRELNLKEAKEHLLNAEQQHALFNERMEQSLVHALKFKQYIFEAFRAELSTVRGAIAHPKNSVEQLCDAFYGLLLPSELDKMLKGDEK